MGETKTIQIYTNEEEQREIERASKQVSLTISSFCRTTILQRAREINAGDTNATS